MSTSNGYLELVLGPMFSGKTTRLMQTYKNNTIIGKKIAVINFVDDTRYHETLLSSHDRFMIPCIQAKILKEARDKMEEADVILINEGQFFEDLYECVMEMVDLKKKIVYVYGLDGDFRRNKFGQLLDLIPHCDKVEKLTAYCTKCKDGTLAIFSHRITKEDVQIFVGSENYIPLCRNCFSFVNEQRKKAP